MDGFNSHSGGSLHIRAGVIEKIARCAAMEVDGVVSVAPVLQRAKSPFARLAPRKPVRVLMNHDVADIEVAVIVGYGAKIPELSARLQQAVKDAVQNMTGVLVATVHVVVAGLKAETPASAQEAPVPPAPGA